MKTLFLALFLCFSINLFAQNLRTAIEQSDSILAAEKGLLRIGSTFSLLQEFDVNNYFFREFSYNNFILFPITKRLELGINTIAIRTNSQLSEPRNYFLYGGIARVNLIYRTYLETGYYKGNYCSCSFEPYKLNGLNYFALGAGVNLKIAQNWNADLGFIIHQILNDVPDKFSYSIYRIGLNYVFQKKS